MLCSTRTARVDRGRWWRGHGLKGGGCLCEASYLHGHGRDGTSGDQWVSLGALLKGCFASLMSAPSEVITTSEDATERVKHGVHARCLPGGTHGSVNVVARLNAHPVNRLDVNLGLDVDFASLSRQTANLRA